MSVLRCMLDTNIVSELVRRPDGEAARRAASLEPRSIAVSIIVAAELRYGAARRRSARLTRQLETVLAALETLPLAEPADTHYAAIRSELERMGRTIGHNDLLIAAHARALDLTLVTRKSANSNAFPDLRSRIGNDARAELTFLAPGGGRLALDQSGVRRALPEG